MQSNKLDKFILYLRIKTAQNTFSKISRNKTAVLTLLVLTHLKSHVNYMENSG